MDLFSSKVFFFEGELSIVSSAALHAEYDFHGAHLADMWDLSIDAHMVSHAIMDTKEGGAIVFCWPTANTDAGQMVQSFDSVVDDDKGDIFAQYCFLSSENTFFSRQWWEHLQPGQQKYVRRLFNAFYYEGGAFSAMENKLVEWRIVGTASS